MDNFSRIPIRPETIRRNKCLNDYRILRDEFSIDNYNDIEEAKSKVKKLYLQHHPDKGGNTETFIRLKNAAENVIDNRCMSRYGISENTCFEPFEVKVNPCKKSNIPRGEIMKRIEDEYAFAQIYINYWENVGNTRELYTPKILPSIALHFDRGNSREEVERTFIHPRKLEFLKKYSYDDWMVYHVCCIQISLVLCDNHNFILVKKTKPKPVKNSCEDIKCPPGKICNPKTLRCVSVTGKIGKKILEELSY